MLFVAVEVVSTLLCMALGLAVDGASSLLWTVPRARCGRWSDVAVDGASISSWMVL
ncbi:hypothetical protein BDV98DRAFT_572603 [Pterulicium gracile]|uniref:Uncharacterized protein n=1 Tax=Pterulicium gracile TaxID=1884261 RepID=A0A5C3QCB1_9AGAR|nr:hypothetical protein BDV98DRAFT_572603 [Pterula gracilis]